MKTLSPFPYKVEIKDPNKRIKYGELDSELIGYIEKHTSCYNPLIKDYKKNLVQLWCNMVFGCENWDFEDLSDDSTSTWEYRYWLCFKDEENCTLAALKWN